MWLATSIARTVHLDEPQKQIFLNGLRDMPDGVRLCHGDFHPMNVLGEAPHARAWILPDSPLEGDGFEVVAGVLARAAPNLPRIVRKSTAEPSGRPNGKSRSRDLRMI